MKLKKAIWICAFILIAQLLVCAQPKIATEFYGTVTLNGTNVTSSSIITAYTNGSLCGSFTVVDTGRYGSLSCEGMNEGDAVDFYVNGSPVAEWGNNSFYEGAFFEVNLTSINRPPVLDPIGTIHVNTTAPFVKYITANDPDLDPLTFSSNSSLWTINSTTGLIYYWPISVENGTYHINISVTDGTYTDWELITFIVSHFRCGDGICTFGVGETCVTCSADCGSCPPGGGGAGEGEGVGDEPAAGAGAAQGGGGAEGAAEGTALGGQICIPHWVCDEWCNCSGGVQYRNCTDLNDCSLEGIAADLARYFNLTVQPKPSEIRACELEPTCFDGIQNQLETGIDCGGPCPPCPTCFDGIQNQGEEGVDCGGPCAPCTVEEYALIPFIEQPAMPGCGDGFCDLGERCTCLIDCIKFPWEYFILGLLIIAFLSVIQFAYLRYRYEANKIKKGEYLIKKRRLFSSFFLSVLVHILICIYLYFYGSCPALVLRLLWFLLIMVIVVPTIVFFLLYHFGYSERRKQRRLKKLSDTHKDELENLEKIESTLIANVEISVAREIYALYKEHEGKEKTPLLSQLILVYNSIMKLYRHRVEGRETIEVEKKLCEDIKKISDRPDLANLLKDVKLSSIHKKLQIIETHFIDKHQRLSELDRTKKQLKEHPIF